MRRSRGQRLLSFPKGARLLERKSFLEVKERGRGFVDGPLASSWLPRPEGSGQSRPAPQGCEPPAGSASFARVGITVSSKVGNSVVRNRIKRKLREAARHELAGLPSIDLVLVARSSAKEASVADLRRWLKNAARRISGGRGHEGKR